MAEKTLKTRIQLKYDTLANWNAVASTFIPKKGEICFVEIPSGDSNATNAPTVLFKVGDGKTAWGSLKWGSALSADVYSWAKASSIKINGATKTPSSGVLDLGNYLTSHQDISGKQNKAINLTGITAKTVEDALIEAKKAGTDAQTTANGKYSKPSGGIPLSDLASAVQSSLGKADSALQSHQTIATGSANGTIAVAGSDVAVKGLGSAAYTNTDAYATAAQGEKADSAMPKAGGTFTGSVVLAADPTADLGAATKKYVDNKVSTAISGVTQFDIQVVTKLPETGKKGVIYLILDETHSDSQDIYDEYIWNTAATTPAFEKIGNTDVDLSNYYKKADVNTLLDKKQNAITSSNKLSASLVSGLATVATSGSYDDLTNKPTIDNNNQKVKAVNGNTTTEFGANDVVAITAGTNITITGDSANKKITINGKSDDNIKSLAEVQIKTHGGIDKVGTVTSVSAGTGLKITGTASVTPTVDIDDSVTFIFDCGGAE